MCITDIIKKKIYVFFIIYLYNTFLILVFEYCKYSYSRSVSQRLIFLIVDSRLSIIMTAVLYHKKRNISMTWRSMLLSAWGSIGNRGRPGVHSMLLLQLSGFAFSFLQALLFYPWTQPDCCFPLPLPSCEWYFPIVW